MGIADLKLLKGIFTDPPSLLQRYKYGISMGVSLDQYGGYNNTTVDKSYAYLEEMAKFLEEYIQKQGFKTKFIPCDQRVKGDGPLYWRGAISHKAVAKTAGLGWLGKSMLLITSNFGPRVFLITVLTDMPLIPDDPEKKNRCGTCIECIKSCPLNALIGIDSDDHPNKLKEAFSVCKCGPYIEKTWEMGDVCWGCLLACPYGKN